VTATYSYWPNTNLVANVTFVSGGNTVLTDSRTYDSLLRQTVALNTYIGGNDSLTYTYNARNQRTQAAIRPTVAPVTGGGDYYDCWNYTYDSDSSAWNTGQLTNGTRGWNEDFPGVPGLTPTPEPRQPRKSKFLSVTHAIISII
jgi:hypothetical protein